MANPPSVGNSTLRAPTGSAPEDEDPELADPQPAPRTLVIERRLSRAQARRRDRVRASARALAEAGGYGAVTMDAVASRSEVARATIYRYFSSKDHLLSEVAVEWGETLAEALRSEGPRGDGPAARVASAFRRVLEAALDSPRLTEAVGRAAISSDPEALRSQEQFLSVLSGLVGAALGDAPIRRRADREKVLGNVLFSALVNITTGRFDERQAVEILETAADLLFAEEGAD